ncbi:hypothetical protein TSUD_54040 [Trifolium subterraneum]|uniref:Trichome birefringence-like N-terminal domain-containing protein n=1 Tax=Trifolium subterraneum TaxID=3900 RepID=A0A2Z6MIP3_TRISU|nr:hypothetical protein TSUD_54040 [Trifolium subterraneum]
MSNNQVEYGGYIHRVILFFLIVTVVVKVEAKGGGGGSSEQCDYFTGKWTVDESYPLYKPATCPFIEREFRCVANGRPDLIYTHYRWQPLSCNLLRLSLLFLYSYWLLL